jgi:hypothetical protein
MDTPNDVNAEATQPVETAPTDSRSSTVKGFWQRFNSRRLELRNAAGKTVFGAPLGWSLIALLALIVTRLAFIAALAFIVLLIMKYQFVVSDGAQEPHSDL